MIVGQKIISFSRLNLHKLWFWAQMNFCIVQGRRKYYPGFKACCRIRSDRSGISPVFSIRSLRYCQNDTPNFRQVFFKLVNVSRHWRPDSLRVLPLILRFLTYSRIAFSAPLLCKGISGRFRTKSNSGTSGISFRGPPSFIKSKRHGHPLIFFGD